MPLALMAIAIILIVTGIKGNQNDVAKQFETDFTGATGFFVWIGAILLLGVTGRILNLPQAAKMLTTLIIAVFLISQNGVFTKLAQGLSQAQAPAPADPTKVGSESSVPGASGGGATPSSGGGGSSGAGIVKQATGTATGALGLK